MKNKLKRLSALLLAGTVLFGSSLIAGAADIERSYTYNYDWWGDVQDSPDAYEVTGVYTSVDLGLEKGLNNPNGLYINGSNIYVCDTGNNRIIEITRTGRESFEVSRIIEEFKGDVEVTTLSGPTDIAISEDGNIFIADKGNCRILKLDKDLNYLMQFDIPVDSTLDPEITFQPHKIVVDTAERVYCIATGINKGLIKYENDGVFSGFVGATKVTYDFADYLQKKFATQAQREQMVSFVPTEYANIFIDYEGFIYAVANGQEEEDLDSEQAQAVRKLNLMGNDILVRNGEWPIYGDLYWGSAGGYEGPSQFEDVTCMDNDIYVCLDKNRGRLFGYDDQGKMVFAFGSNGNMDGYFRKPIALDHMGHDLFVLDILDCSITLFTCTEFGETIYNAIELFDEGAYEASGAAWERVMEMDGNYDLAYIGIGRSLLRQKKYREAMDYFELKYDEDNYSKAFKQYRKEWVEDNIVTIVVVLLILFLVPLGIGKVKSIKHEIDIADIFRT